MKLTDAAALARDLMAEFDLIDQGWIFRFDRSTIRFGSCRWKITRDGTECALSLSRHLVALNEEAVVEDTIRHEIAHALAGRKAGHGPAWRAACAQTGAKPDRCYDAEIVARPEAPWRLVCHNCGSSSPRWRRNDRYAYACQKCRYDLVWERSEP